MSRPLAVTAAVALAVLVARASEAQVPPGWRAAGEAGLDSVTRHGGRHAAVLRNEDTTDFATLRQGFRPDSVRGKRIRFTAFVRTELASGGAALWMRVDGAEPGETLAFDNMLARQITGRTPWAAHAIVLDVPPTATSIVFGLLVSGVGRAWMDDVRLEVVPDSVRSTDRAAAVAAAARHRHPASPAEKAELLAARARAPRWPVNLDFERSP